MSVQIVQYTLRFVRRPHAIILMDGSRHRSSWCRDGSPRNERIREWTRIKWDNLSLVWNLEVYMSNLRIDMSKTKWEIITVRMDVRGKRTDDRQSKKGTQGERDRERYCKYKWKKRRESGNDQGGLLELCARALERETSGDQYLLLSLHQSND